MDLDEYRLTEGQRTLKRLGITHLWQSPPPAAPAAEPVQNAETATCETAPDVDKPAPEAPLPVVLRSLFHGKQPPVRTLWTYDGMHADMRHAAVPPRLSMMRKIQESVCAHLGWKETDISSWPLDVEPRLLQKGIAHFRPKVIIRFGADEASGLRETEIPQDCTVIVLPDLAEMAAGNKDMKNEAWKLLRTLTP